MKAFNLEKALAGDPIVFVGGSYDAPVEEIHVFSKSPNENHIRVAFTVQGRPDVLRCRTDGCNSAGNPVLLMATKTTTLWFVRSTRPTTQNTRRVQGYWQSNLMIGEDGKAALLYSYDHRITSGEMTLHSIEIED